MESAYLPKFIQDKLVGNSKEEKSILLSTLSHQWYGLSAISLTWSLLLIALKFSH